MKFLLYILLIAAPSTLPLFTCSSAENLEGTGGFTFIDYDPARYFRGQSQASRRAAVITFKSMDGSIAYFDAFVTDEVIRRLSGVRGLTLVERSRIDLILEEHALAQSGVVSGSDAVELGKLLSVDHLIIGTYNYADKTIFVRGRILDAVTGKILKPFGFKIPYAGSERTAPSDKKINPDKGCEDVQRPVLVALRDLTTPAAVKNAVDRAVEIPWKKPCGNVHIKISSEFSYSNLYPQRYHIFLARTLEDMEDPRDEYYIVREIFSYFARDGKITEFEWAAARETLKRSWHPFHLKYLFKPDKYNTAVIRRRALELYDLARKNEIGRPYAITEYRVAYDILTHPFMRTSEKGIDFSLFLIRALHNTGDAPDKQAKTFFSVIATCYKDTLKPEYRREALEQLIRFLKPRKPDKSTADELWYFLHQVDEKMREKRKESKYIPSLPYKAEDLIRINTELNEYLCLRKKTATGSYSENEVEDYFRRYRVRCSAR